ncbi:FG-GAP-like repeat-containing protein [Microbulbifer sp. JMSA004]|uniref:FG-GAP-like repeat-containing protein n=1 Tax=Microbulbifer sp. JMSA004 TaxID=3243370 RepID=UPI00403A64C8
MRIISICLLIFVSGFLSANTYAFTGIWDNGYHIYSGDINGDGKDDLYFEYHRPIIMLHGDVTLPVAMAELPSFVMFGALIGYDLAYTPPVESTLTDSEINTLELLDKNISLTGDFNGDGASDLLVLSSIPLILHADGNGLPDLAQSFPIGSNTTEVAVILSGANPDLVIIEDIDGDGRDDILVEGVIDASLIANAYGTFDSYDAPIVTGNPNMAGMTAGQFRVNESGAATYSVPIVTAPGTAGVTPGMSLSYTGNGGNGLLGRGWSIGGLSGISRCRQTLASDENLAPISWSESDRFCLDGQRLVVSGGDPYGAVGATYKTELDSFAKITSVGGSLGAPGYFTVERKDGSISYYGNSDDAKLLAGGNTLAWAQNRFEDSVGNHIEFHYEGDETTGHRIQEVRYAYGSGSYEAEIEFKYGARPEYLRSYIGGYELKTTKRLEKVVSKSDGDTIREYSLGYKPVLEFGSAQSYSDRTSLLSTIQECVGSSCLPAVTFDWLQPPMYHDGTTYEAIDFSPASSRFLVDYKYADVNGDGKQDIIWIEGDADDDDTDTRVKYAISNGTKFVREYFSGSNFDLAYFTGTNVGKDFAIRILDYNGDGRQDLAIYNSRSAYGLSAEKWHVFLSRYSGSKWQLSSNPISTGLGDKDAIFADFNGDGLSDYISAASSGKITVRILESYGAAITSDNYYKFSNSPDYYTLNVDGTISGSPDKRVPNSLGDFNGDGAIDLLIATYDDRWGCVRNDGGIEPIVAEIGEDQPLSLENFDDTSQQISTCSSGYTWTYLGATYEGHHVVTLNHSDQTFNSMGLLSYSSHSKDPIAVDINGDGLTDIAYIYGLSDDSDSLVVKLSTGTEFVSLGSFTVGDKANFADLNNDGYPDLVWPDFDTGYVKVRYFDQNTNNFVNTTKNWKYIGTDDRDFSWFVDTNGDSQIDYHKYDHSSGKVYTQLANDLYPEYKNTPRNVIQKIDNGIGNVTEITYANMLGGDVYSRLEMSTSTSEECVTYIDDLYISKYSSISRETICFPVTTSDPASLYSALNGDWILPSDSHTLGRDKPVLDIAAPMFLISKVDSTAPAAGINPGSVSQSATSSISYHYHQMKLQAAGRGMLGFQKIRTTDDQTGVVTETTYRQDFPFTGMPLLTETRTASGEILKSASNNWRLQGWTGSGTPAVPYKPYIYNAVEDTYDLKNNGTAPGDLLRTVSTTSSYDEYGNALTIDVVTTDAVTNDRFIKETVNIYGSSSWDKEMGRLSNTTVTNSRPGMSSHVRESSFTYYSSGIYKGLLKTEVIEPGKSEFTLTTSYEYDDFGNIKKKTVSAAGEVSRSASSVYDPSGRYLLESYNALGHLEQKVVSRNHFGAPLIVESANGLISYFSYDAFGREGYSWNNAGADKKTQYERCVSSCANGAKYKVTTSSNTGSWSREYFDSLGRSVRAEVKGLHNSIYTDKEYDSLGRVKFFSEPYFSGDTRMWTETEYDLLGRPILISAPDDSTSVVEYLGLTTVTTNDAGQQKTEIKNIAGELIEVVDAADGRLTYEYDSQGNLHKAKSWGKTNASGGHIDEGDGLNYPITVTINYDDLGRKESMDDPDKGSWTYKYTGFGELKKQTNANGHTVEFTYDALGRKLTRVEKENDTNLTSDVSWLYDTAQNGLGLVESITDSVTGYQAVYQYDHLGRNNTQAVDFDGNGSEPVYVTTTLFDDYGRVEYSYDALDSLLSSGQSGVRNYYNSNGYLYKVTDLSSGDLIQEVVDQTARGQLKEQLLGNGATTSYTYEGSTGRLLNQSSTVLGTFGIQDITYQWDTLGNLTSRHNQSGSKNLRESFCYDNLNRLIKTHIGSNNYNCSGLSSSDQDIRYNTIGNITYKSDVGSYTYGENGFGPHAVTTAGGVSYSYDANGNMTSDSFDGGRSITYTTFDKASLIVKGNHSTEFLYAPNHSRYYRKDTNQDSGEVTETWYIGGVERIHKSSAPNEIEWKRHLGGVAVYTTKTDSAFVVQTTDKVFLYKDHLGSMDLLTDDTGSVVQEMSFDAWGQRRNTANWSALSLTALTTFDHSRTTRGYTGHEMLDEVGLIHMNGRIYDPRLGRFLQADPFVQAAADTQMYNRYSYVRNNALNATDPSGYFLHSLAKKIGRSIIRAAVKVLGPEIVNMVGNIIATYYGGPIGSAIWAYEFGRAMGVSTGDALKSAGLSYIASYAFGEIGSGYEGGAITFGEAVFYSGMVGGTMSVLQGGKFGHGFVSAAVSTAASPVIGSIDGDFGKVAASAVVGGTVSNMTGGKFANGAVTAAFKSIITTEVDSGGDFSDDELVGKMVPEVQWDQLDDFKAYQAAAEGLAVMENDLSVDQGALKVAQYSLGARWTQLRLSTLTITSRDITNGLMRQAYLSASQDVHNFGFVVLGGTGLVNGGVRAAHWVNGWPRARKLFIAEALRRSLGAGVEEALNVELPSTSGLISRGRIPSVPKRPSSEYTQPF